MCSYHFNPVASNCHGLFSKELWLLRRAASLCLEVLMLADGSIEPKVWIDGQMDVSFFLLHT